MHDCAHGILTAKGAHPAIDCFHGARGASCRRQALGDRKGIHRFGEFTAPLDEALIHVVLVRCSQARWGAAARVVRNHEAPTA